MENVELERMNTSLRKACTPEEVFGDLMGTQAEMLDAGRRVFRQMAKVVHPDLYQGTGDFDYATSIFKKMALFWEQAQVRIGQGIYGMASETFTPFVLRTKERLYTIEKILAPGDLCSLYVGTSALTDQKAHWLLKVPFKPADNDLVSNEARILEHLRRGKDYHKLCHFVSQLDETFSYQETASGIVRQVNVLSYMEGLYSLQEVRKAYTKGIDPKDMAWIWRRLLVALGFAHANNVIHGAVLPIHVLLHPQQHGVILIDWSYAVLHPTVTGERIGAISRAYREWYPTEVFAKEEPTPALDIAMAAMCMIDLLGGNPHKRTMPAAIPWQIQNYLKGCALPDPSQRSQDVGILLDEFDHLIEQLWGPRRFHEFVMPTTC